MGTGHHGEDLGEETRGDQVEMTRIKHGWKILRLHVFFLFFSIAMFESQGVGGVVGHGWRYVLLVASYFSTVSL